MKRFIVVAAVFCLLAVSAFAQKATDFSGEWTLNKDKSTLSDRMKTIESMTLTVAQTDKDIKVTSSVKRGAPPAGGPGGGIGAGGPPPGGGMGGGGGRGMGGGMGMGDQSLTYTLDGKETSSDAAGPGGGNSTLKTSAKWDGAKLGLTNIRSFTTPDGERKSTTTEVWELQADGSLKVKRTSETQRGTDSNELVFTKKGK
jgi:hypothetical protein